MSNNTRIDALIAAIAAAINSLQTEDTGQLVSTNPQELTANQQAAVSANLGLTDGVTIAHLQQALTSLQSAPVPVPLDGGALLDEDFASEFAALLTDPYVKAAALAAARAVENPAPSLSPAPAPAPAPAPTPAPAPAPATP